MELPEVKQYGKDDAEWEHAAKLLCNAGSENGKAFFGHHPGIGFSVAVSLQCELTQRETQLKHYMATARLILRAQLTQQFGRNPTDSEMDTHWRMWLDAGKRSVGISEEINGTK